MYGMHIESLIGQVHHGASAGYVMHHRILTHLLGPISLRSPVYPEILDADCL